MKRTSRTNASRVIRVQELENKINPPELVITIVEKELRPKREQTTQPPEQEPTTPSSVPVLPQSSPSRQDAVVPEAKPMPAPQPAAEEKVIEAVSLEDLLKRHEWDRIGEVEGWWRSGDYQWRPEHAHIYRAYCVGNLMRYSDLGIAPPPPGAILDNWPPQGEKAWKDERTARACFYQWLDDQKDRDRPDPTRDLASKMEKEREDYEQLPWWQR